MGGIGFESGAGGMVRESAGRGGGCRGSLGGCGIGVGRTLEGMGVGRTLEGMGVGRTLEGIGVGRMLEGMSVGRTGGVSRMGAFSREKVPGHSSEEALRVDAPSRHKPSKRNDVRHAL